MEVEAVPSPFIDLYVSVRIRWACPHGLGTWYKPTRANQAFTIASLDGIVKANQQLHRGPVMQEDDDDSN